jgi:hypothetical protein
LNGTDTKQRNASQAKNVAGVDGGSRNRIELANSANTTDRLRAGIFISFTSDAGARIHEQ